MNKKIKAFTLIELLVVIAIVGILSGFIFVSMSGATNAAKDAKRKSDLAAIAKAVTMYSIQNSGSLPSTDTACNLCSDSCSNECTDFYTNIQSYLSTIPMDPNGTTYYTYTYSGAGPSFTLSSNLSNSYVYQFDSITSTFSILGYSSTCVSGGGLICTETTDGSYVINTYTYSSAPGSTTWQTPTGVTTVEYLVIGGGGGGSAGGNYGGGGGAGQFLTASGFSVSGNLTVTVGTGGGSVTAGNQSVFSSITASGGSAGSLMTGGTSGNGYTGGTGSSSIPVGGGGGAGSSGNGSNNHSGGDGCGGDGGIGTASAISGATLSYAGGGGGAGSSIGGHGGTGIAGGGNGGINTSPNGGHATAGTGSGGGGAVNAVGGNGGSGIVVIRYLHP